MGLQEADMGVTDLAMQGAAGRYQGDEHLLVKFFMSARLHDGKSKDEGRPIYEDVPYVQIMTPGNKDSIIIRPATDLDKQRFAERFRKFEAMEDQEIAEGTPLSEVPWITRVQCEELKYLNIRTVEQLANLADSNAQNIMGVQMLKQKAVKYIESAKEHATAEALQEAQDKIAEMQEQMNELLREANSRPATRRKAKAAEE